jgi:hypothetical protein
MAYQASGVVTPLCYPLLHQMLLLWECTFEGTTFGVVYCQEGEDICGGVIGPGNDGGTQQFV